MKKPHDCYKCGRKLAKDEPAGGLCKRCFKPSAQIMAEMRATERPPNVPDGPPRYFPPEGCHVRLGNSRRCIISKAAEYAMRRMLGLDE